jgi:hypothetical protein
VRSLLLVCAATLIATHCMAQEDCYYLLCDQGCNPHDYPYSFQPCPATCEFDPEDSHERMAAAGRVF